MKVQAWLLAGALAFTPFAWAGNCPNLMNEVDAALESNPDLDAEMTIDEDSGKSVTELRAEGEKLHEEGNHAESVEALEKALALLNEETG